MTAGFKIWVANDILTAADLNDYLMEQAVTVWASAGARDATILSPQEGQFAYIKDTDSLEVYNGTGWRVFPEVAVINAQGSGTYTLGLADAGKIVEVNSNGTSSVFIPANSATAFPTNTVITILQSGASPTFIAACPTASWVSFTKPAASATSGSLSGRYAVATLIKSSSNTWYAFGNLA